MFVLGAFGEAGRELGRIHSMPRDLDKNACCDIDGADVLIYGALIRGRKSEINW
jgi:hypothetical protein